MFEKRRKEIQTRREEIRALLAKAADEELEKLERELDALDSEEAAIAWRSYWPHQPQRTAGRAGG